MTATESLVDTAELEDLLGRMWAIRAFELRALELFEQLERSAAAHGTRH